MRHPLISRYPGSTLTKHDAKDFDRYRLIVGLDLKGMTFETRDVEGALTRIVYTNPAGRSTLEIFRNYRGALDGAGAEILYACEENACGPGYARSKWGQTNGLFAASDGDPRYVAARVTRGQAQAYVAVMVGKQRPRSTWSRSRPWTRASWRWTPRLWHAASRRTAACASTGSSSTWTRPRSVPSPSRPGRHRRPLRAQPGLSIFVVGHTDSTGALDHNFKLSARAPARSPPRSVATSASRRPLDAHGAGPLAPVAPNTTEDGRQLNRRWR